MRMDQICRTSVCGHPLDAGRVCVAADVDARIGALPGLAGIGLLRRFVARAARRSDPTIGLPSMAVVLGGTSQDVGAP